MEFEALLTFVGNPVGSLISSVSPDPSKVSMIQHHSFIKLPDNNYKPRIFDPRSGALAISFMDYATPVHKEINKKYILRHRLEKINPSLEKSEAKIIEKNFKKIEPYISEKAKKIVKEKGKYVYDKDGKMETPLVDGKACVYVHYNFGGVLECGIEKAYNEGAIKFKKPLSCHLYPIRIKEYSSFTAVNYHRWGICSSACSFGKELKKPLYEFVKEALIKRFGSAWYQSVYEKSYGRYRYRCE